MSYQVRIEGFDALARKLAHLGQVKVWARPIMDKAIKYVHSQVPPYPPARPTSRYRRTGTLGRSITTEVRSLTGNDVVGIIGSAVVYAPDVISSVRVGDRGPQKPMHKGRWWTLQGVVTRAFPKVREIFGAEIKKLLG